MCVFQVPPNPSNCLQLSCRCQRQITCAEIWACMSVLRVYIMLSAQKVFASSIYLTYADVCWRMLTYADVCWRMLTHADVCWNRWYACFASSVSSFMLRASISQAGFAFCCARSHAFFLGCTRLGGCTRQFPDYPPLAFSSLASYFSLHQKRDSAHSRKGHTCLKYGLGGRLDSVTEKQLDPVFFHT